MATTAFEDPAISVTRALNDRRGKLSDEHEIETDDGERLVGKEAGREAHQGLGLGYGRGGSVDRLIRVQSAKAA
jgi:hypothetical protein